MHVPGHAIRIKLHVEHALGDDPAIPRTGQARILDGMLEIEEHAGLVAFVALVYQHGAPFQEIAVSFQRQVDHCIEQWVPGTHERGQRLTLRRNQRFLEGDALVARQNRLAETNQTVSIPNERGNVGDLVASNLALLGRAAQAFKRFAKERLDVVRL